MHSRIVVAVNWTLLACGQEMSRRASQPAVITADCGTAYHCDELKEVQGYFIVNQGQGFGPSCTLGRCTHLGASRCKCVPIVPIKLRGFIPFL